MLKSLIFIEVLFALLILSARGLAAEPTAHAKIIVSWMVFISMRRQPTLMVILIVLPVMAIFLAPTLLSGGLFQHSSFTPSLTLTRVEVGHIYPWNATSKEKEISPGLTSNSTMRG